MTLTHQAYVEHLRNESARFVAVLRDCAPGAAVPPCPDWSADDLLWHLGEVQWLWGSVVADLLQDVAGLEHPERPPDHAGLLTFFEDQSRRLVDALTSARPEEPAYMWSDDKTVGYIARRQAHEALIHRLDAELTCGEQTPLDADLASDGVDEVLTVMFGGCPPWGRFTPSGPQVEVVTSDTGLTIPVALGRFSGTDPHTGTSYDEEEVSVRGADPALAPSATVRGSAEDLDAWLWHRRDATSLDLAGDPEVLARLTTALAQPID